MSKSYKEINETPELYDSYDEFIDNEGYLYDDFIFEYYAFNEDDVEEGREEWD